MELPVLIEPVAGNSYRARGPDPFGLMAEGATPEEALHKLHEQVRARVAAGVQFVGLELGQGQHPWTPFAGMFRDDPLYDEWQKAIADYREERNAEEP